MNWADIHRKLFGAGVAGVALREAQGDYMEIVQRVRGALQAAYEAAGKKDCWPDIEAVFADRTVVRENGALLAYPLSVAEDGTVSFGQPQRVVEQFVVADTVAMPTPMAQGAFIEATGDEPGRRFIVRIIRAGLSDNANFYSDAVLREAAPLFEGARVFVKSDAEHIKGAGKDIRNLVGCITDIRFVEGRGQDTGELQGTFDVLQSAGDIAARLTEAVARRMTNIFGLSVDADGRSRLGAVGGKPARIATKISRVRSVDLIVEPGAGGELIRLVEAKQESSDMWRDRIVQMIEAKRPDLLKNIDIPTLSDEQLDAKFREAFPEDGQGAGAQAAAIDPTAIARQVDALVDARVYLREAAAASGLPQAARERVARLVEAQGNFTRAHVDQTIKDERDYVARFTESGRVSGLGTLSRIEVGETRAQKVERMLDAFLDPAHQDHRHAQSFREAYVEITGDRNVTGRMDRCDSGRLTEALDSGSFSLALGDAIARRLLTLYRSQTPLDLWRGIAVIGRASDFRDQHRVSWGGYGDLPVVAESDPYLAMTSPADDEAKYKVSKRGGTESLTLEMIKNDDVGMVRDIPNKLQRSAKRTLSRGVFNTIIANPTIYDGKALFHVDHGNLDTVALGKDSYAAGRVAMLRQTEPGSSEPLYVAPKHLLVPAELEQAAYDLFVRNLNNDPDFVNTLRPQICPVWCQTDASDWTMMADPSDMPTIEVGFLDGNEEPELFVQDNPSVGSLFTNDTITYKIRHVWGVVVLNYRGIRRNIVA